MEEGVFREVNLNKCNYQFLIRHAKTNCFSVGEVVFLKSNIENPMTIHLINNNDIVCTWKSMDEELQFASFKPECILQYRYRCLVVWKGKFQICLN